MRTNWMPARHLNDAFADRGYCRGMSDALNRPIRSSVILYAHVETDEVAAECRVRNLSTTGACIDNGAALRAGDRVRVTMGTLKQLAAEVVWAKPALAGLRFDRVIDIADARRPRNHVAVTPTAGWAARIADPYRSPRR